MPAEEPRRGSAAVCLRSVIFKTVTVWVKTGT